MGFGAVMYFMYVSCSSVRDTAPRTWPTTGQLDTNARGFGFPVSVDDYARTVAGAWRAGGMAEKSIYRRRRWMPRARANQAPDPSPQPHNYSAALNTMQNSPPLCTSTPHELFLTGYQPQQKFEKSLLPADDVDDWSRGEAAWKAWISGETATRNLLSSLYT